MRLIMSTELKINVKCVQIDRFNWTIPAPLYTQVAKPYLDDLIPTGQWSLVKIQELEIKCFVGLKLEGLLAWPLVENNWSFPWNLV